MRVGRWQLVQIKGLHLPNHPSYRLAMGHELKVFHGGRGHASTKVEAVGLCLCDGEGNKALGTFLESVNGGRGT